MTEASDGNRDFFVSFNQADRAWATWIAWVLEEKGYSVFFQDWDFRGSFLEQMHQASQHAGRTLVVLSDHYLRSEYARSEAWAALACDPVGREDRVVTVKIGPTNENLGLFSHFVYLDLTTTAEADAERLVFERARKAIDPDYRAKPPTRPDFPGGRKVPEKPSFPGGTLLPPTTPQYSRPVWNAILGFQNDNPGILYQRQLCVTTYEPGTFTLNEITTGAHFLYQPCPFNQWVESVLNDELSLIATRYPQLFMEHTHAQVVSIVKQILALRSNAGQSLRHHIWFQEYSDILRRTILFVLVGDPDYELDLYPQITYNKQELLFHVLKWLEDTKHPTIKEWLHLSIAAGLLGVNEKSIHAATSNINTDTAIDLRAHGLSLNSLVQRVGNDLWNAAKTACRIDATEIFFHTLRISAGHRFKIAVFSDDYLETIVLLSFYEKLITSFANIEVDIIPRSIRCGNDASYEDVREFLLRHPNMHTDDRLRVSKNGPTLGTVNLLKLHKAVLDIIEDASLIDARGARNYEMMQGINKEVYFSFMVCREFSESVIGLFAEDTPLVFIRQLPGEESFEGFRKRYKRIENGKMLAVTTARDHKKKWEGGHLSDINKWSPEVKERYETILKFYSNNADSFHTKYGDYMETEVQTILNKFAGTVIVIGCGSGKEVAYLTERM